MVLEKTLKSPVPCPLSLSGSSVGRVDSSNDSKSLISASWWFSDKESTCNAGDAGSILGWERFPRGGHDNPLQYSCLENPMDWGAWWAIILGWPRVGDDWSDWGGAQVLDIQPGFSLVRCQMLHFIWKYNRSQCFLVCPLKEYRELYSLCELCSSMQILISVFLSCWCKKNWLLRSES